MGRQMPPHAVGRSALACERRVGRVRTNQVCGPPYVWGGKCLPPQWGGRRSLASAGWGEPRTNQVCGPPYVGGVKCLATQWGGRRSLASAGWGEYVLIRFARHHQDVGRCELHLSIIRLVQLLDQQPL